MQVVNVAPNQKIEGQTFIGAQVQIDGGCAYVKCRFVNCMLNYAGVGPVQMEANELENCRYQFVGPAGNTFNFLRSLYASGGKEIVEQLFASVRSNAGAQTVAQPVQSITLQ